MIDLSTTYLGLSFPNPLVVSAGPLCEALDNIRRMEDAGAAAVVLHSLFEEQIEVEGTHLDRSLSRGEESYAEAVSYFPDMQSYTIGPDAYLEHIRRAKAAGRIPVIGSLNGISTGGWIGYARKIEEASADALELNVYYIPTDADMTGEEVERRYTELVRDVKASVGIPVAVKLGHTFSAPANLARRLDRAGADALVLFNRFYLPSVARPRCADRAPGAGGRRLSTLATSLDERCVRGGRAMASTPRPMPRPDPRGGRRALDLLGAGVLPALRHASEGAAGRDAHTRGHDLGVRVGTRIPDERRTARAPGPERCRMGV